MKVFAELSHLSATASKADLREKVRALEDVGATGVAMSDHLFASEGRPRADPAFRPGDALTVLAAVAGLSDRLELSTLVVNTAWIHPALVLRQFAQLALLIGGERVTAGLGAGWNAEEFDAIGMPMRPFKERIDRLEETLAIARQLFDGGVSTFEGTYVSTRELPISPLPATPPRLLVGGGSARIMDLAGRYADVLDLHGDPKHGKLVGKTVLEKERIDASRRALTTVEDQVERVKVVRAAARAAGRAEDAVDMAVQVWHVVIGSKAEVERGEAGLCARMGGLPPMSLARCPYVLLGEPRQIADTLAERRELFGLREIRLKEDVDALRFCREVLPLIR